VKKYKHQKYFTVDGHRYVVRADTLEELYEKMARKKQEIREGGKLLSPQMTLKEWTRICYDTYKTGITEDTRRAMEDVTRSSILTHIGDMRLQSIRPIHCQQCLNHAEGYSKKHIIRVNNQMKFLFARAVDNNLIRKNPAENLTLPSGYTNHKRALTAAERAVFEDVTLSSRRYYGFALMLFCGCRPKEARTCRGYDLSVRDGVPLLHIRGTKTEKSDRYVPVPEKLWEKIKDTPAEEPIGTNARGDAQKKGTQRQAWDMMLREINIAMGCKSVDGIPIPPLRLAPDISPYNLRHEFCTELARHGVDIRIAQRLMGHASVQMTANVYTNLQQDDIVGIAATLPGVAQGVADKCGNMQKNAESE